ncbi:hypothetical protein [Nocardia elegans]|uniref:hypothetical protein n=1 Tax=Nocardia elegans TaxID=300029 RepID=UPI001E562C60|nr:hypothetical protein [Nocardia elegans]
MTAPAATKPAILSVDDDPGVSRAVVRDLRRRYGADYRILRAESGPQALDALREAGAIVYTDGAGVPLPPSKLSAGSASWGVAPREARWVPPVVAIAAAVRSAASGKRAQLTGAQLTSVAC